MEKDDGKLLKEIGLLRKRLLELEALQAECNKSVEIAAEAKELTESIIDAVRDPFVVMDADLKIVAVNKTFYNTFSVRPDDTLGKHIYAVGNRQWDVPKLRTLLESILVKNAFFDNYVIEHDFPVIGRRVMVLNARRIPRPPAKAKIMLLVIEDITDMDKVRMTFEKMLDMELFSKIGREQKGTIDELRKEVNALLTRLGEKLKYISDAK
jgi:PAS domain-containing protein